LINKFRKYIFWFLDFLKGGRVRKHYKELYNILEKLSPEESKVMQDLNLKNVLNHAVNTTPFYKNYKKFNSLNDFPIINKNLIRENFKEFQSNTFQNKKFIPVVTSGSTGTPFKIYHDINKRLRNYADTIYFAESAGYNIGDKLFYLKIWSENNKKSPLQRWMQNIFPVDVLKLTDESISEFIELLNKDKSPKNILGYASALDMICKYIDKLGGNEKNNIKSIIAISESLSQHTKEAMTKFFSVPVLSRYSNLENGILAQQSKEGENEYYLNVASYRIEIFDMKKDELLSSDKDDIGRIVVTDLFNYSMPMIRYDTGDVASMSFINKGQFKVPVLKNLEGRKLDLIYDTLGNLISSYLVYKNMWKYTELKQYQVIQEDEKEYLIKLNTGSKFNRENEIISEFKSFLGNDAHIKIDYVNEIPLLASGKRKKVASTYLKKA
jgi:phenylacetate-CoA ligase